MESQNDTPNHSVCCECGKWHPINIRLAGPAITCSCGFRVVIPLLEEFENRPDLLLAATLERRLRRLISNDELPPEGCIGCGELNSIEVVPIQLICERSSVHRSGGDRFLVLPFFPLSVSVAWHEEERVQVRGRDTDVIAPVFICPPCRSRFQGQGHGRGCLVALSLFVLISAVALLVGSFHIGAGFGVVAVGFFGLFVGLLVWRRRAFRTEQLTLKKLLAKVPIYRQILERYPWAVVLLSPEAPPEE